MYYAEELIEEVRSRNDIVDVISGVRAASAEGISYFGLCPFHSEKSRPFRCRRASRCIIASAAAQAAMSLHF